MLAATRRITDVSQTTAVTRPAPSGLLIYDGDCGFCTSAAKWFDDHSDDAYSIAPWQLVDLGAHGLTEADVATAVYWAENDTTYRGADGIARSLRACGPVGNIVGLVGSVPPAIWLARLMYPIVAKYRHRLPGATDHCRLD